MTARILVVDAAESNAKLLEALLLREFYDVVTADKGAEAFEICLGGQIDVIILDVAMPDMDGFEVCRRLKDDQRTTNIPVIILAAVDSSEDKIKGLEAGADDFLSKPAQELQLLSCVKNLARLKMVSDELLQRTGTIADTELEAMLVTKLSGRFGGGEDAARILVVDENEVAAARLRLILGEDYFVDVAHDANTALIKAIENDYDSIVISASYTYLDPLRLCSQMRTIERTRLVPIILIVNEDEGALVVRALELGVNDYVMRPLEKMELYTRLRTQIKRKCYNDLLRQSLHRTITMAVTDSLTGLHNRRYLDMNIPVILARATARVRPLSVVMIAFDHFKPLNDKYGHDGGDDVLREFAMRLRKTIRGTDVMCRYSSEEFAIVLPDSDLTAAKKVAERIRNAVAQAPFLINEGKHMINMTISIGIAGLRLIGGDTAEDLFARTDAALYEAKKTGRNRIVLAAA